MLVKGDGVGKSCILPLMVISEDLVWHHCLGLVFVLIMLLLRPSLTRLYHVGRHIPPCLYPHVKYVQQKHALIDARSYQFHVLHYVLTPIMYDPYKPQDHYEMDSILPCRNVRALI